MHKHIIKIINAQNFRQWFWPSRKKLQQISTNILSDITIYSSVLSSKMIWMYKLIMHQKCHKNHVCINTSKSVFDEIAWNCSRFQSTSWVILLFTFQFYHLKCSECINESCTKNATKTMFAQILQRVFLMKFQPTSWLIYCWALSCEVLWMYKCS